MNGPFCHAAFLILRHVASFAGPPWASLKDYRADYLMLICICPAEWIVLTTCIAMQIPGWRRVTPYNGLGVTLLCEWFQSPHP